MDILKLLNGEHQKADPYILDEGSAAAYSAIVTRPGYEVKCFTLTLHPRLHSVAPRSVRKNIIDETARQIWKNKSGFYCEFYWETTKQAVLHAHGIITSKSSTIARVCSFWRNLFGHVYLKTPFDISKWRNDYCQKQNIYRPNVVWKDAKQPRR